MCLQRARWSGGDLPAGMGGAGAGLRLSPCQQHHRVLLGGGKREPPGSRKIEKGRLAGKFHHHCRHRGIPRGIEGRAKNRLCVRQGQQSHHARIDTELSQAGAIGMPALPGCLDFADPDQRAAVLPLAHGRQ